MTRTTFSAIAAAVMLAAPGAVFAGPSVDVDVLGDNVTVEVYINQNTRPGPRSDTPPQGFPVFEVVCYMPGAPVEYVTSWQYVRPMNNSPCWVNMVIPRPWGNEIATFFGVTRSFY